MEKVLVGLSGGVDSAAVARRLLDEGYRVYGTYLSLCPGADPERAGLVAEKLGIPFTVVKREKQFQKKVITPFVDAWQEGITPNPCVECNRFMKFASLLQEADRLGIETVATGHYARIIRKESGRYALCKAVDENKDQSYFLWRLTQKMLSRILFPLADLKKEQVRALAGDLVPEREKESMDICFIPGGDTQGFLEQNLTRIRGGDFVTEEGRVLGPHRGIHRYTIGQRRGLGVAMGERYFVTRIKAATGQVILGPEEDLLTEKVRVSGLRFVSVAKKDLPREGICMKGRNRGQCVPCEVTFEGRDAIARFSHPVRRIAPGQSVCFYRGDELLFGGIVPKEGENL